MVAISRRYLKDKLIKRKDIKDEIKLIKNSITDYITSDGKVYKDYGDGWFYPKKNFINHHNGYVYTGITYPNGNRQRRVHILVAETWIPNPDNKPIVMHKDNNKLNNSVDNLKWGTVSENTQQAVNDGLLVNDKGYEDSQSMPVIMFDVKTNKIIGKYGSISEAGRITGINKQTIRLQALNKRPVRKPFYFRFQKDIYNVQN